MDFTSFLLVSASSLGALAVLQVATWFVGRRLGRVAVVDAIWGPGFGLVALVGLLLGDGDLTRRLILALLSCLWGGRLGWHIALRSRGKGEDPRYAEMLKGSGPLTTFLKVFALQGLLQWFISLPLQVSAVSGATHGLWWIVLVFGVVLWMTGVAFEAIGDAQLARFKADPENKGKVMDQGLWAWTRHPNYFGDACVWWGMFAIAASAWPGVLTVLSPAVMTYLLVWGSGARLLERSMAQRPGYREYMKRTSGFFPLPPRKSA